MLKRLMICMVALALGAALNVAPSAAQQTKPAAKGTTTTKPTSTAAAKNPAPAASKPAETPLPVNIKVEVTITDQAGTNQPSKKVVSMMVGDRQRNSIRSSASVQVHAPQGGFVYRNVTINVDARPAIIKDTDKISMGFGIEYLPKSAGGAEELEPGMSQLNEQLSLILESGKTIVISQAADPMSDRKITVEVTATILK